MESEEESEEEINQLDLIEEILEDARTDLKEWKDTHSSKFVRKKIELDVYDKFILKRFEERLDEFEPENPFMDMPVQENTQEPTEEEKAKQEAYYKKINEEIARQREEQAKQELKDKTEREEQRKKDIEDKKVIENRSNIYDSKRRRAYDDKGVLIEEKDRD